MTPINMNQVNRCIGRALTVARQAKAAGRADLRIVARGMVASLNRARSALRRDDDAIAAIYATAAYVGLRTARMLNTSC